jgi:hypothetical protein
MRRIFVTLVVIFILPVISCTPPSQYGKKAVESLKKFDSKIEVGINYQNFISSLGEVNFEVKSFLESPEAESNPKLRDSVKKVMEYYKLAQGAWGYKNTALSLGNSYSHITFGKEIMEAWIKSLSEKCPEVAKEKDNLIKYPGVLCVERTLNILLKAASDELKKTESLV